MGFSKWNFHLGTQRCWPLPRCIDYKLTIDRPSEVIRIPESRKLLLVKSGIQETFPFGIRTLGFGIRNPTQGIWNLANDCNTKSKLQWEGIRSPVPEIHNLRLFWRRNWPALCFSLIAVNSLLSPSQIRPLSLVTPPPQLPFQGKKVNKLPSPNYSSQINDRLY